MNVSALAFGFALATATASGAYAANNAVVLGASQLTLRPAATAATKFDMPPRVVSVS
jgi:hypothetical protein